MLTFNEDVQAVSISKPMLKPYDIHEVNFDGVTIKEIQGVKDTSKNYVIMEVTFSNDKGTYTHSMFMPKEGDEIRGTSSMGFEMPSNFEVFRIFIKQLASVLVGEEKYNTFFDKVKAAKLELSKPDHFKKFVEIYAKLLSPAIGKKKTNLKLMGKLDINTGRTLPTLPYFAKINRDGELYPANFIGENLFFASAEKTKVDAYANQAPTQMEAVAQDAIGSNDDLLGMQTENLDMGIDLDL